MNDESQNPGIAFHEYRSMFNNFVSGSKTKGARIISSNCPLITVEIERLISFLLSPIIGNKAERRVSQRTRHVVVTPPIEKIPIAFPCTIKDATFVHFALSSEVRYKMLLKSPCT